MFFYQKKNLSPALRELGAQLGAQSLFLNSPRPNVGHPRQPGNIRVQCCKRIQSHRRPFCMPKPDADLCMRVDLPLDKKTW